MPRFTALRGRLVGIAALAALAALPACGSGTEALTSTTPTPTMPTTGTVVPMGMQIDTTRGTVTVHAVEAPATSDGDDGTPFAGDEFVAADVEACGGAHADKTTGITPGAFHLELGHFVAHPAQAQVRQPVLRSTVLGAGRCVRGWVTFEIPQGAKVAYVIFTGSKVVAWRVS